MAAACLTQQEQQKNQQKEQEGASHIFEENILFEGRNEKEMAFQKSIPQPPAPIVRSLEKFSLSELPEVGMRAFFYYGP